MKQALLIFALLLVLSGMGAGVYFLFSRTAETATPVPSNEFGTLFPVSGDRTLPGDTQPINTREGSTTPEKAPSSRSVASVPVSTPFIGTRGSRELVRYFESQTGHLYELGREDKVPIKLSNTTIPGIQEVLWGKDGSSFVLRYQDISSGLFTSLLAKIVFATSSLSGNTNLVGEVTGTPYPQAVTEMVVSPDRTKLFYLSTTATGIEGFISDFENKNTKKIFSSPFREWNIEWPSQNTLFLTSKASGRALGNTLSLDPLTGKTNTILSNRIGLATKGNPSGKDLFLSESTELGFETYVYSVPENLTSDFPFATFPEKCAWSTLERGVIYCATPETIIPGTYPDAWYQGLLSFNDSIWRINALEGGATILYDPQAVSAYSLGFDAINLTLNGKEDRLYFTDKTTGQLRFIEIPQTVTASSTPN